MTPEEIEDVIDHILLEVCHPSLDWQSLTTLTDDCPDSTGTTLTSPLAFSKLQTATSMMRLSGTTQLSTRGFTRSSESKLPW